jgi:hypothetical protein
MKKELLTTNIKREQGKLYYCGTNEEGFIVVCEAIMSRGGKKKVK